MAGTNSSILEMDYHCLLASLNVVKLGSMSLHHSVCFFAWVLTKSQSVIEHLLAPADLA